MTEVKSTQGDRQELIRSLHCPANYWKKKKERRREGEWGRGKRGARWDERRDRKKEREEGEEGGREKGMRGNLTQIPFGVY